MDTVWRGPYASIEENARLMWWLVVRRGGSKNQRGPFKGSSRLQRRASQRRGLRWTFAMLQRRSSCDEGPIIA
jgi:hypothetical protein